MLDLLIKNGRVIDGSGTPWYNGSVGICGDSIVFITSGQTPDAYTTIDASGRIVCPGFIDIHTHTDTAVIRDPQRLPKLTQGVTTEVVQNCGVGVAPVSENARKLLLEAGPEAYEGIGFGWLRLSEYMDAIPTAAVNIACLVPHATLRLGAMGYAARPATPGEIGQMCDLLKEGMSDGAFGLTTGLTYVPMVSALTEEILGLCKTTGRAGGFLASHIRNQRETVRESIEEMALVAREADMPVHIAHYQAFGEMNWGRGPELQEWIVGARDSGLDLTFDSYPYDFSAGWLRNTIPPKYTNEGIPGMVKHLRDPLVRQALRHEIGTVTPYDLNRLSITGVNSPQLEEYIGMRLPKIAESLGKDNVDFLADLLIEDPGVAHVNFQGNAEDVRFLVTSDFHMVGSDSIDLLPGRGRPHPRLWGAFTRFLRLYVREERVLSWEKAIYKMTGFPAWRLGLDRRGMLKPGFAADVVILDPTAVSDQASLQSPEAPSTGIEWVIVNGVVQMAHSKVTGLMGGQVLRRKSHWQ